MEPILRSYFFILQPLSKGLPILLDIFLRKGIMEPTLPCVFYCPPAWSCPQVFNSGFLWGMRLCEGRFDKELFSCINFRISKLFQTHKSFWHWFKANLLWRKPSDSYREVFKSDENFLFCFWWKYEVTFFWSRGSNFNLRVTKNRFSKHSFYLDE